MHQIFIDMFRLPKVDGLKHLVVCIYYFRKWSKPIKGKRAFTITQLFFFWHNIKGDVEKFTKICDQCKKQGKFKKVSNEFHSIPLKTEIMQQTMIDIFSFPEVDSFKHLVICIDCFSTWLEVKSINPFVSNVPLLYPLKTSENLTVF